MSHEQAIWYEENCIAEPPLLFRVSHEVANDRYVIRVGGVKIFVDKEEIEDGGEFDLRALGDKKNNQEKEIALCSKYLWTRY